MLAPRAAGGYRGGAPLFDIFAHPGLDCSMLAYLSGGTRRYGEQPIRIYGRPYWEFQAVVAGAIAPTFPEGPHEAAPPEAAGPASAQGPADRRGGPAFHTECLWVFPPGLEHGWTGPAGTEAEVAVFHFDAVAEPAASFLRREGLLRVSPGPAALERIARLRRELEGVRDGRDPLALLKFDAACLELSIIALEALGPARTAVLQDRPEIVAAGAEAWYSEHMAEDPSVAEVARRMNCSESHFRRLFQRSRGRSPQDAFAALRLERAAALLARGGLSIKEIAALCGYGTQSCFSRAFKRATGKAPREIKPGT